VPTGANIIGAMPTTPNRAVAYLGELLAACMGRNSRLSLSEALVAEGGFFELEDELVDHLIRHRSELSSWMRAVLEGEAPGRVWEQSPEVSLRGLLMPWLQEKNQFLGMDDEVALQLDALYRRAIRETERVLSSPVGDARAAEELRGVWEAHRERLASFVRTRLGEDPRDVVCAEYSPSLQLAVLGFASGCIMAEPVLDVGCGPNAVLVRHLRERGVEAYGIDRAAPEGEGEVVAATDWLDFSYGEDRWGTVISHLGLSLHFLRHHLAGGPSAETLALAHADAYMRILRSLRVGGTFSYTPALPFVERLLSPLTYRCERVVLPDVFVTPTLLAAREHTGFDLAQASRVLRTA
jgi:hypothetical protein